MATPNPTSTPMGRTTRASRRTQAQSTTNFFRSPQDMFPICDFLKITLESAVHRDLVVAICQVSGYGETEPSVKKKYDIDTRSQLPDGTLSDDFTEEFKNAVDDFLKKKKRGGKGAGSIFFPEIIPDYDGWRESFYEGEKDRVGGDERLIWNRETDQVKISHGVQLLFENIKNGGSKDLDLSNGTVFELFLYERGCKKCGSGDETEGNQIIYCESCDLGHHQLCYDIKTVSDRNTEWFCNLPACKKAEQEARKRQLSLSPPRPNSQPKHRPAKAPKKERQDSPALSTPSRGRPPVRSTAHSRPPGIARVANMTGNRSSSNPPPSSRATTPAQGIVDTQESNEDTNDTDAPAPAKPENADNNNENEKPAEPQSSSSEYDVIPDLPLTKRLLTDKQMRDTILLIRYKSSTLYTQSSLHSGIFSLDKLIDLCTEQWRKDGKKGKLGKILQGLPDGDVGWLELGTKKEWEQFVRILKGRWGGRGEGVVYMKLCLLGKGEGVEDL